MDFGLLLLARQLVATFDSNHRLTMQATLLVRLLTPEEMVQMRNYFYLLRKMPMRNGLELVSSFNCLLRGGPNKLVLFAGVGFRDEVQQLLSSSPWLNLKKIRKHVIKAAAMGGRPEILGLLSEMSTSEKWCLLRVAAQTGQVLLLEYALSILRENQFYDWRLKGMVLEESPETLQFLVEHVPALRGKMLVFSVEVRNLFLMRLLLDLGEKVTTEVLVGAAVNQHWPTIEMLLDSYREVVPEIFIYGVLKTNKMELIRSVLRHPQLAFKAESVRRTFDGIWRVKQHQLEIADLLFDIGARADYRALWTAAFRGDVDLQWYMVQKAIPDLDLNQALVAVANGENVALAQHLLDRGATSVTEAWLSRVESGPMNDFLTARPEVDLNQILLAASRKKHYKMSSFVKILDRGPTNLDEALVVAARKGRSHQVQELLRRCASSLEVARKDSMI